MNVKSFREEIKGLAKGLKEGVLPEDDLRQIARKHNVDVSMFMSFWEDRFPNNGDKNYAAQWAKRIAFGSAFGQADSKTKKALQAAGFKESMKEAFKVGDKVKIVKGTYKGKTGKVTVAYKDQGAGQPIEVYMPSISTSTGFDEFEVQKI